MSIHLSRRGALAAGLVLSVCASARAQFLFDATKAEMAGNADWVIDADTHNLGPNGSGTMVAGDGNESNPQTTPTPAASGITAATGEAYWNGAISAWGVSLVKAGKTVNTLPYNGAITYGNGSNAQDLSHYKVFVVDEPNIKFTSAEKTAIYKFVKAGNALVAISDHVNSDRNGDGIDSTDVWTDFLGADGTTSNPFGITLNNNDISPDSLAIDTTATDPLTHGSYGSVSEFIFHDGTSMTINPSANSSIRAAVGAATPETNSNVLVAYGRYGLGKFVLIGDSSPIDDGTGDSNDTNLFDGWDGEANGNHARLVMNASLWVTQTPEPGTVMGVVGMGVGWLGRRRGSSRKVMLGET